MKEVGPREFSARRFCPPAPDQTKSLACLRQLSAVRDDEGDGLGDFSWLEVGIRSPLGEFAPALTHWQAFYAVHRSCRHFMSDLYIIKSDNVKSRDSSAISI